MGLKPHYAKGKFFLILYTNLCILQNFGNGKYGKFRPISSCLRSWSGDHIRFSAVGGWTPLCQGCEASASPDLRFTTQSSTAVTHMSTNCYSFVRPFRVKAGVELVCLGTRTRALSHERRAT
jgi:hypothetical protein